MPAGDILINSPEKESATTANKLTMRLGNKMKTVIALKTPMGGRSGSPTKKTMIIGSVSGSASGKFIKLNAERV